MFGIGTTEFLVILLVGVLVLGPEHLPRIMRTINKVMSDFRRVSTDFQRTINMEVHQEEWQRQHAAASTKKKKKKKAPPVDESGTAAEASPPAQAPVAHTEVAESPLTQTDGMKHTAPLADELTAEATTNARVDGQDTRATSAMTASTEPADPSDTCAPPTASASPLSLHKDEPPTQGGTA